MPIQSQHNSFKTISIFYSISNPKPFPQNPNSTTSPWQTPRAPRLPPSDPAMFFLPHTFLPHFPSNPSNIVQSLYLLHQSLTCYRLIIRFFTFSEFRIQILSQIWFSDSEPFKTLPLKSVIKNCFKPTKILTARPSFLNMNVGSEASLFESIRPDPCSTVAAIWQ